MVWKKDSQIRNYFSYVCFFSIYCENVIFSLLGSRREKWREMLIMYQFVQLNLDGVILYGLME